MELKNNEEFDGVFRFSNPFDEDFIALWNNNEYTFKAHTRSPMIIQNETLENIQAIRKKWAFKLAEREWYKSDKYMKMREMGNGRPPMRQDKDLEPLIDMCLNPLPIVKAEVNERPKENIKGKITKPVSQGKGANAIAEDFKDDEPAILGEMSKTFS